MDFTIRPFQTSEIAQLKTLRLKALQTNPDSFGEKYQDIADQPLEFWKNLLYSRKVIGAFKDDEAIAMIFSFLRKPTRGGIGGLWVDPECRQQGLAQALIKAAISHLRKQNCNKVTLWNAENNQAAENLYKKLGFHPSGKTAPLKSNPKIQIHHLVLKLHH